MTTKIIFQDGEEFILPDGEFINETGKTTYDQTKGVKDGRMGELMVDDDERHQFTTIKVGTVFLDVLTKNKKITENELQKKRPNIRTEVKEVIYLGRGPERMR